MPRAGTTDGAHTVSGQRWQDLWFNDTLVGETGINAALCGAWGCPPRGRELLGPGLTTVAAKTGLGTFGARLPRRHAKLANVELVDARTIVSRADDWWSARKQFFLRESVS